MGVRNMLELRQKNGGKEMPQMTVCFCKLSRVQQMQGALIPRDFKTDIQAIINPDVPEERYNRVWRFSQPQVTDGYLVGKLGYITSGVETKPYYDELKHDFIQQTYEVPETKFVLWVIDLAQQYMAFEIKPPDIRYLSFKGAFEKFLQRLPKIGIEIGDLVEEAKFKAWASDVERVTLFKAVLRVPNPHWADHPERIQDYLGNTHADKAKIELIKLKDSTDSLITDNTIIEDAVKYGENGFSDYYAVGEKGKQPEYFDSRKIAPTDHVTIAKNANEDTKLKLITEMLVKFATRKNKK